MSLILSGTDGLSDVDGTAATPAIRGTDANTGIFFPAADTIAFAEGGAECARFDSAGNFGLGVTPNTWTDLVPAFQIGNAFLCAYAANAYSAQGANAYYSTGWKYRTTAAASVYQQSSGVHSWSIAASGTAGNTITFTQAMTLTAAGDLVVGTTSSLSTASGRTDFTLNGTSSGGIISFGTAGVRKGYLYQDNTDFIIANETAGSLRFINNGSERVRITSGGSFTLGAVNDGVTKSFTVYQGGGAEGTVYGTFIRTSGGSQSLEIQNANDFFANAANAACRMGRNSVNSRSLNAGGTVNASGADYAEYMTKAGDFAFAKGDVVGVDSNGKLTNVFADAVSFMVKSTDPSYVGGDTWGSEEALGLTKPESDAPQEDKDAFDAALEAARQRVDRIAFAGQVPVNVMGATAGQYIIPVNDNGAIKGEAVSNPTFDQYQTAVGKVIAIESDGRAKIIVKVA